MFKLTPGALLYQFQKKFGDGIDTAYYRDIIRQKISKTKSIKETNSSLVEIHTLTSSKDWLNTLWSIKSFYIYSKQNYSLCIHDDGSLSDIEFAEIKKHFPNCRIIKRDLADKTLETILEKYPLSYSLRKNNPFSLKVFDFAAFSNAERIIYIDSDILFFSKPEILIQRANDLKYAKNTFNKDWSYGYSPSLLELKDHVNFSLDPLVNSGLGLLHKASIDFTQIEQFLKIPGILSHPYGGRSEQTLIGLCSCRYGFEFLPQEYDVHLKPSPPDISCRHYVSPIRHLMYKEGIRKLAKQKLVNSI